MMKILVLKSSGNKKGSSAILADEFIRGAKENGHEITEYNVLHRERARTASAGSSRTAHEIDIRPCTGCNACGMDGPCVQKDDMQQIYDAYLDCDVVAFATPVYWFTISGQLKIAVDRLYAI